MRILVRTSKWAIWSRRIGSFALPLAVIPVFMHRERLIASSTFEMIELLAMGCAVFALVLAIGAVARLWVTGDRGWGKAAMGAVFGLICLLPLAYGALLASRFPDAPDVTTNAAEPPPLMSRAGYAAPDPLRREEIRTTFPNVTTRTYPLGSQQLFALVNALVQAREWDIRVRRAPPTPTDEGQLNAVAMRPLGWRDEISIRIRGEFEGSTVDMRSAALSRVHDLGANGGRIEEFLLALDEEVTVLLRDAPAAAGAATAEEDPG